MYEKKKKTKIYCYKHLVFFFFFSKLNSQLKLKVTELKHKDCVGGSKNEVFNFYLIFNL